MKKILIVDDVEINREMLAEMLKDEYAVEVVENGRKTLKILKDRRDEFAVVLLDLVMPDIDGFTILEIMKTQKWINKLPVIVISGEDSKDAEKRSMILGASDYIRKPFDNLLLKVRIRNTVDLFSYKAQLEKRVEQQQATVNKQYKLLKLQTEKLKEINTKIIDVLGTVVECRNLESGEHIQRVKKFTEILAKDLAVEYPEYGLNDELIAEIVSASALHDIGKIAIPDNILLKPGKLTNEEFEFMKSHASKGADMLEKIRGIWDEKYQKICYDICRHHHERYDGTGYPDGLKGDEIPIAAQIVSIADVYDALVSERVYKKPFPPNQAYQMILAGECGLFSPKLLDCLRNVREKFEEQVENR